MGAGNSSKILNKSKTWHKHGKHKGNITIAAEINRQTKPKKQLEKLDIKHPDWGTHNHKTCGLCNGSAR